MDSRGEDSFPPMRNTWRPNLGNPGGPIMTHLGAGLRPRITAPPALVTPPRHDRALRPGRTCSHETIPLSRTAGEGGEHGEPGEGIGNRKTLTLPSALRWAP